MTTGPISSPSGEEPAPTPAAAPTPGSGPPSAPEAPRLTRTGAIWVATGAALLVLVVLIVFMLQNSTKVEVHFLGMSGTIPLGLALLIAAVGGGLVVAIAGVARVTQLRVHARRARRGTPAG